MAPFSAVVDVNGTSVTSKDINMHLLKKIQCESSTSVDDVGEEHLNEENNVYLIPRSNIPVNDCANPEFFLGLFPTLFPYGCGAPHDQSRPITVSLNQHVRHLLSYEDRRFEKHHSFIFVVFNILQRRQACWNASLMASRPYFSETAAELRSVTSKDIETALLNVTQYKSPCETNSRLTSLMRQIRTISGNVMGSARSRTLLRTQIHALIFSQGLPSIFITINPADIQSRIALYFAGVDLDLDQIIPDKIPSTFERAQIIATNPVATGRYFNVLISSILNCLIEGGILGPIKAYFGTVESQGRGSLHLHILLWLDHDLSPAHLKEAVKDEQFRKDLLTYLEDIIKQDLSDFGTEHASVTGRWDESTQNFVLISHVPNRAYMVSQFSFVFRNSSCRHGRKRHRTFCYI